MRFALIADAHLSFQHPSVDALERTIDLINAAEYDVVLVLGDITRTGTDAELEETYRRLSRIRHPLYAVCGNHECSWSPSACQTWKQLWRTEYIDAKFGNYRILGMGCGAYLHNVYSEIRNQDFDWLQEKLQTLQPGEKLIFATHASLDETLSDYRRLLALLKSVPTVLILSGHLHQHGLRNLDGIPNIIVRQLLGGTVFPDDAFCELIVTERRFGYRSVPLTGAEPTMIYNLDRKCPESWPVTMAVDTAPFAPVCAGEVAGRSVEAQPFFQERSSIHTKPILTADHLIYGTDDGRLVALSRENGTVSWEFSTGAPIFSTPAVAAGRVVLGTIAGQFHWLDEKTGELLCTRAAKDRIASVPLVSGNRCYIGGCDGWLYCLDLETQIIVFQRKIATGRFQAAGALAEDSMFWTNWDGYLYCITRSGDLCWKWCREDTLKVFRAPGGASPVCTAGRVFLPLPSRELGAWNAENGRLLWMCPDYAVFNAISLSPDCKTILCKTMDSNLVLVPVFSWDGSASRIVKYDPEKVQKASNSLAPQTIGNLFFLSPNDGSLHAVSLEEPEQILKLWTVPSRITGIASDSAQELFCTHFNGRIDRVQILPER